MKRTGEIVLTVIGALLYAFITLGGVLLIWVQNNKDMVRNAIDSEEFEAEGYSMADFNAALDSIGISGWMLTIVAGLAVILGIVAIVFLKGNKKPQPAGIILLVVAVASLIALGMNTWITVLPYAIAGLMALLRKPKQNAEV